jgi:hypothetical protein
LTQRLGGSVQQLEEKPAREEGDPEDRSVQIFLLDTFIPFAQKLRANYLN